MVETNNLGQLILQTQLDKNNTKVQIPLKDVVIGMYYYKIKFGDKEIIGKLNIMKL